MLFKKKGLPEESEIVICTVKKVLPNSIFASLDEYENQEGLIHISEIAPGRIRNIRDYVKEGKTIVCKVIKINEARGHIDLSLRRVSHSLKAKKINENKQEERHEKILNLASKDLKLTLEQMYEKAGNKILDEYGLFDSCFQEVVLDGEKVLLDLKIDKKIASALAKIIKEKIKPPSVTISAVLELSCPLPNGIEIIKKTIKKIEDSSSKQNYDINLTYLGAPKYRITIKSSDYKKAEEVLKEIEDLAVKEISTSKGTALIHKEK
jgi:translation initiation factor 2 subunit 1